ncbi:hypothetical protein FEDK69T_22970 [Flavobacterium enshiense DK69]|uniref:Peptidase S8/S53 domain-containing protein n=1 Tax=Flavobacterium enshiense DK69 TaxID=1107311 RepID=V6S7D0_9FLAO|nr:S8 family serine peptidase [Flavobacterium enshiense]ESU22314.1 hypothetical protein FEDK69T_22970 [Flavobacterium enshiense DK69]KGO97318.1 hypothetical protein Q767_01580 [Flavobacterium enshiense DK69]
MDSRLKIILHGNPEEELALLMRLTNPSFYPKHSKIITQFGDIVSCRIKRKYIQEVYSSKEVKSLKAPKVIPVSNVVEHNDFIVENQTEQQSNKPKSNVVFGIIDFGFDFTHQDFIDSGKTRFEKIWVQSNKYDGNHYGYGSMIDANLINASLNEEYPFRKVKYHPGKSDLFGTGTHGTHVLGIACSNGSVSKKGFASDSPILAVDMGSNYVNGSNFSLGDSVKLVEGLHFLITEAKNRPLVINMSLGGHGDAHMGKTLVELAIDNILTNWNGVAAVHSGGNYCQSKAHTFGNVKQNEKVSIPWLFKKDDITPNELEIWYEGEDRINVRIIDEFNKTILDVKPFQDKIIVRDNDEIGICLQRKHEPNTGLNHINILLNGNLKLKFLTVELTGAKIRNGKFHCYIERDDKGQSIFFPETVKTTHTTNSICNSRYGIAVGAYNQNAPEESILPFSSSGPTVDGRMKPEILAPGFKIVSSCSSSSLQKRASNKLCSKSGSSMAAPFVASLIVKILEKEPKLNIYQIRKKLFRSCRSFKVNKENALDVFRSGFGYIDPDKIVPKK